MLMLFQYCGTVLRTSHLGGRNLYVSIGGESANVNKVFEKPKPERAHADDILSRLIHLVVLRFELAISFVNVPDHEVHWKHNQHSGIFLTLLCRSPYHQPLTTPSVPCHGTRSKTIHKYR